MTLTLPLHPLPGAAATRMVAAASLLVLLTSPSVHAVQDCELAGKPINTSNGAETAGKTGMVRCKERDTGQMAREYELRNGDSVGLSRYYRDGKLSKEFTITANGPHEGLEREWAANGQLVLEFTNVNGNPRGLRRQWFEDGKPRKVEWVAESGNERDGAAVEYREGGTQLASLRCGPRPLLAPHVNDAKLCGFEGGAPSNVNLYGYKGDLRSTVVLKGGVEQKSTTFFANGKPQQEEELQQQGTQRRETTFAEDGVKRRERLWDVTGRPALMLREAEFHTSGSLVAERSYAVVESNGRKRSRLATESRFYLNGQPQQRDVFTPDGNNELRDTQRFTDQGKLKTQGRYVLEGRYGERPVGVHKSFFASGKTEREETFDAKGNMSRQKVWDESGKLVSDDELFEDGSRKAYAK